MPSGGDPPSPTLPSSVLTALKGLTYDSSNQAYKDTSGNLNYMFTQKCSAIGAQPDEAEWNYGTVAEANVNGNPWAYVPSATSTVITKGTYNQLDGTVSYNGYSWRFQFRQDTTSGNMTVYAWHA